MASAAMKFEFIPGKILCLVTQPDACCFSFRLREDAKGQGLLDAVSLVEFLHFSSRSKSIQRKARALMKFLHLQISCFCTNAYQKCDK